jgi:hypothetical protein
MQRRALHLLCCLPFLSLAGCASLSGSYTDEGGPEAAVEAPPITPATPEAQLLVALEGAVPGAEILLPEGVRAVAGPGYAAASGRHCREARLSYPDGRATQRLACKIEGRWQWVPAVTLTLTD